MSESQQAAAPESGHPDPEIAALLLFEPVARQRVVPGAWTPELQREFIARLAVHGSPGKACEEMGKNDTGVRKLYASPTGASFAAAWDAAIELAQRRRAEQAPPAHYVEPGATPPSIDNRRKRRGAGAVMVDVDGREPLPGQVLNENGLWEDEENYRRRGEEVKDSICGKLLNARRLYLMEVSRCPGKRAAFEMLTELPIDWDKAAQFQPQADEPWRNPRQRDTDMILTHESGWSWGEIGYGPDRLRALREQMDAYREEQGLPAINWDEGDDD